jgi:hypothetical protein
MPASTYLAPTFLPILSCPTRQVLDAVQRVIMRGVPDYGLTSPSWAPTIPDEDGIWTSPQTGAPAAHFFLPQHTFLYRSDLPDEARGNAITLHIPADSTRRAEDDPRYWLIPVEIQILWMRQLTGPDTDILSRFLEQLFSEGFTSPTDGTHAAARHYLSSEDLHIFDIRDIKSQPIKQSDGWKTSLTLSLTYLCAARRPD